MFPLQVESRGFRKVYRYHQYNDAMDSYTEFGVAARNVGLKSLFSWNSGVKTPNMEQGNTIYICAINLPVCSKHRLRQVVAKTFTNMPQFCD